MQTLPPVRIGRQRSHDPINFRNRFYTNFNRYIKRTRHQRSKIAQRRYEKQVQLHMARQIEAVEQAGAVRMQKLYEDLFGWQARITTTLSRSSKWLINLVMIVVLSGCSSVFGGKDKNTPATIELSPLEAVTDIPWQATLTVQDPDGIASIRVTSPDSSWTYSVGGVEQTETSFTNTFSQEGSKSFRVTVTDEKDAETTREFSVEVHPRNPSVSAIVWEPRTHEVTQIYRPETRVMNVDGIDSIRVTRGDTDKSRVFVGDGSSLLSYEWSGDYSALRLQAPVMVEHTIEVYDPFGLVQSYTVPVNFIRENVLPQVTVEDLGNGMDTFTARIIAQDDYMLSLLEFDFGFGLESVNLQQNSLDTLITRHFDDEQPRDLNYMVRITDDEGGVSEVTGTSKLRGLATLNLTWQTYLDETPVDGGHVIMRHREIDFDTTLVSVGGQVQARIPRGSYEVLIHANPLMRLPSKGGPVGFEGFVEGNGEYVSNISRVRLSRDFLPSVYESSFWHGGNETFVLSGTQIMNEMQLVDFNDRAYESIVLGPGFDVDFYLELNKDLSSVIETLENNYYSYPVVYRGIRGGYTLEEISRQTYDGFGVADVPLASEPLVFAFNWGDSNCKPGWTIWDDNVCTVGRVPGALASEDAKDGFRLFYNDLMSILNGSRIGINPYLVEMVEGYSEDISDRIIDKPNFFNNLNAGARLMTSNLKNGVFYYGLTNGHAMAANDVRNRGPPYTQDKTLVKVFARFQDRFYDAAVSRPAVYAGGATNESRFIGRMENMFTPDPFISGVEDNRWRIPMFGSSRDPPTVMLQLGFSYLHPDYGVIPVRRTFLDKDVRNIKILHGFAPFGQQQYLTEGIRQQIRDFVFDHGGTEWQSNSLSNGRDVGFNLQFYHRYQDKPN